MSATIIIERTFGKKKIVLNIFCPGKSESKTRASKKAKTLIPITENRAKKKVKPTTPSCILSAVHIVESMFLKVPRLKISSVVSRIIVSLA